MLAALLLGLTVLSAGCSPDQADTDYVAKVYDRYLTREELREHIPISASQDDSLKRAKVFINAWVKEQVVLEKAEFNFSEEDDRFQSKLDAYLDDLKMFEYEQQLVRQTMDTSVTKAEMMSFYKENSKNFILKDFVVRARVLVLPADLEDQSKLIGRFRNYNEEDSLFVLKFAEDHKLNLQDKPDEWIYVESLLDMVPITPSYFESKVKQKSFFDKEEDGQRYLLFIREYKLRDSESPFEMERDRIRTIILNTRKRQLLEDMRTRLFQDALDANQIEIK